MPDEDEIIEPGGELVAQRRAFERQPGEPSKEWAAFVCYRDLGISRSLAAVSSETGVPKRQLERWSSKWGWVERVAAYEIEQDRLDREALRQARNQMIERHQALAAAGLSPVFKRLLGHGQEGDNDFVPPLDPNALDAGDLVRFADVFTKMERGAYGDPVDFTRGAAHVPREQVFRVVGAVFELALEYVPSDLHEAFIRDFQGIGVR